MTWKQLKKPNTGIPVTPGWCLTFVQNAFGTGWAGPTATDGWNMTKHKHKDKSFPKGVAVPLWFSMQGVSAGHVVIRMSDGSIYSTSSPTSNKATHHPSYDALMQYYGGRLGYRGWSEDLNGMRVVQEVKDTKGKNMPTEKEVKDFIKLWEGKTATKTQIDYYTKKSWTYLANDVMRQIQINVKKAARL